MLLTNLGDFTHQYQVLYVDPPWKYGGSGGSKWAPASSYYSTLSFSELSDLKPVFDYISDPRSCLVFLWVVNPELKKCIEVGESWGFRYITTGFFWYKERANVGNYTMPQVEQCLILKKGKIPVDRVRNPGVKSFHSEPINKHSKKPDEFAKRIQSMFPVSNKLELFATELRDGWDSFGDALGSNSILEINYEIKHKRS